jgi:hypothetical protein
MKQPSPSDPLRAHCLELCQELLERTTTMRDYAMSPGNAWLAKNELQQITQTISELEQLVEEIKQADAEN